MVNKFVLAAFLVAAALAAASQSAPQKPAKYQIRSWQRGNTRVQPVSLNISLSAAQPVYNRTINDAAGQPRYQLSIRPLTPLGPPDGVIAWHIFLTNPGSADNLLLPSNSLSQEEYEGADYLWWLYPGPNRLVPITAARVIQVDGFYLVIRPGPFRRSSSGRLESLDLKLEFTNTPPHI